MTFFWKIYDVMLDTSQVEISKHLYCHIYQWTHFCEFWMFLQAEFEPIGAHENQLSD